MDFHVRDVVGLDFETYGAVNLPERGLWNYTTDDTFTPLIACLSRYDEPWNNYIHQLIDFTVDFAAAVEELRRHLDGKYIAAHNAPFEQRVLASIGIDVPSERFIDSAVVARACGAGSSLEAAAPQLLGSDKLEAGKDLIVLFSLPGKYQDENGDLRFDPKVIADHPFLWQKFKDYCRIDAELSLRLVLEWGPYVPGWERRYQAITMDMNNIGWPVDVPKVEEMQRRYLENVEQAEADFRAEHDAADLNLNSLKQLKEWCAERGIKAKSFDEKNVAKLRDRILKKLDDADAGRVELSHQRYVEYCEVVSLLNTKQILGGSSLKKLQVILDTTGKDARLRDQYLHIGAGQSYRTTGRGVQMQNLKRLSVPADMDELDDLDSEWNNDKLAENIRQVFTSSHPQGQLIVGDFSSVESRGLAWLAGAEWKLEAFRKGMDMYKVGAAKQFGIDYNDVSKDQRQFGKVGELSCGYQAGGGAVQSFAEGMGVVLTEGEANKLVSDWRAANPEVVQLWADLDEILNEALDAPQGVVASTTVGPKKDYLVKVYKTFTPTSLHDLHVTAHTLRVDLINNQGGLVLSRWFHGCYRRGRSICYWKPTERKTGDVWVNHFTDPKTKQVKFYSIYGGKLAGILTQSFCREIFFRCLSKVHAWTQHHPSLDLIGQFHDEIVVDWKPGQIALEDAMMGMNLHMSDAGDIAGFPLEADIKHDYRYTK